jgi:hypothetical protein
METIKFLSSLFAKTSLILLIGCLNSTLIMAQNTSSDGTLKQQLEAQSAAFAKQMPAPLVKTINDAIQGVEDTGILDNVINVGDKAPDFELPDATGKTVKLSSLLAEGSVVLTWYRGNW